MICHFHVRVGQKFVVNMLQIANVCTDDGYFFKQADVALENHSANI